MAKIGLKYLVVKPEAGTGVNMAKMIQADVAINMAKVKLYADDSVAESDTSFQDGTLSLNISDLSESMQTAVLGHKKVGATEEVASNVDDEAPYVGAGFYGVKMVNNVKKWRALWFPKIQFTEPGESMATKAETLAFGTDTIVGDIHIDVSGNWKFEQTFTTEAAAVTYLNGKAGIVVIP